MADPYAAFASPVSSPSKGDDPYAAFASPAQSDVDYAAPTEVVRAKIGALPGSKQAEQQRKWADTRLAKQDQSTWVGRNLPKLPDPVRGLPIVGSYLDEAAGAINDRLHTLSGGKVGAPYAEAVEDERAKQRAVHKAHPTLAPVVETVGGMAVAGPLLSRAIPAAQTMLGNMARGAAAGGVIGGAQGFGEGEGGIEARGTKAAESAMLGAGIGAVAPPVIRAIGSGVSKAADVLSPGVARIGGALQGVREKMAIRASASPPPPAAPGAQAAGDQIIANQLARANVSPAMLRQRFAEADDAARMSASGRASNAVAPVDVDPALQRLAGSAARKAPEAANLGQAFVAGRQTGQPPGLPMPTNANIPTRPAMAPPDENVPMGQFERVSDAMKRALQIKDYRAHGHQASAHRTEQAIVDQARTEAQQLYGSAYQLGQNVNLRPVLEPIMQRWEARMMDEPRAVGAAIRGALNQFRTQNGIVGELERFDKGKQFLDGTLDKLFNSVEGRNRYVGGVLTELKNDLVAAVDAVPQMGPAYQAARNAFSSAMTSRDALRLGREVFRENSEIGIDHFRTLATEGERKLFRLGLLDSFANQMSRMKRTADVTQLFESPRVQHLLQEVIPRSRSGVFSDRPERFGRYIANEKRMIGTRNEVFGNSKTAQRLSDDESYEMLSSLMEQAREAMVHPSASNIALRFVDGVINKLFGMRADTATAIAQRLFTADPVAREALLSALERRMGTSRAEHFARLMAEHQQIVSQVAAAGSARATDQNGR